MDFITGLPMTMRQHDSIMVVVDKLTMASHFIPVKSTYKEINSNRDTKFTSNFWKDVFAYLGTKFNFSTLYHP